MRFALLKQTYLSCLSRQSTPYTHTFHRHPMCLALKSDPPEMQVYLYLFIFKQHKLLFHQMQKCAYFILNHDCHYRADSNLRRKRQILNNCTSAKLNLKRPLQGNMEHQRDVDCP
ncbi:hypothetical protein AMECASPLE_001901 [Ameca splendens]|uniref:Uncharacterized protein n=1 Tax=Ameca splendens TaxID=208324 RepID=A0ABV0XM48_9TELE